MELVNFTENGILFFTPEGRIDTTTASEFQENALKLMSGTKKVAVDFAKVNYISSAGLRSILMLAKESQKAGGNLLLYSMNSSIKDIFDMAGFSSIIKIVNSREEAIEALN